MARTNTCLQINMAPSDIRHVVHTLPHQLRVLGNQVSEIQFTLDNRHSHAGRYATQNYAEKHAEMKRYLEGVCETCTNASVIDVDYSEHAYSDLAQAYFGGKPFPLKAYDGSPFHAYLFGVRRSKSRFVFHIDSDMLFGGGSQTWFAEAIELLSANDNVRACAPLDGPPRSDGFIKSEGAVKNSLQKNSYEWRGIGTRVFLVDQERFFKDAETIPLVSATGYKLLKAYLNNQTHILPLEICISEFMVANDLLRVDFLGSGDGLWQLHPLHRSEHFYAELPNLISRIESGDIPEAQRGDHNINESMIDLSDVHRQRRLSNRLRREVRLALINTLNRFRASP